MKKTRPSKGVPPNSIKIPPIVIEVLGPGQLRVSGFPNNLIQATLLMADATKAVIGYFNDQITQGNMDDKGTVTQSKIIKPNNKLSIIGK